MEAEHTKKLRGARIKSEMVVRRAKTPPSDRTQGGRKEPVDMTRPGWWRPVIGEFKLRPDIVNTVSVVQKRETSKLSDEQRSVAARNKFHFYERNGAQIGQYERIRRSYL
ncbi:MAG: hypothetical protein RLZZ283_526 [Candidatus Parcubacteria bacterium]|jgi:hypothetical protein